AVEDGGHGLQAAEVDVESAERRHDDKVGEYEGPAAGPGAPEPAPQIGNVDAYLNRERTREGLADRDSLTHLLLSQPTPLGDELALHLADQCHWTPEAEKSEAQEVAHELLDGVSLHRAVAPAALRSRASRSQGRARCAGCAPGVAHRRA